MAHEELITTLRDLIERNKDSARGFLSARNDVTDDDLTQRFDSLSAQRADMVDELQRIVRRLGNDADEDGSAVKALERGWLSIKAAMTIEREKTDAIVLANRAQNEEDVVAAYEEALAQSLPPEIDTLLQRQYEKIQATQEQLAQLEGEVRTSTER